ncbi:MAG: MBL fold metallo-hydrolase, partial [Parasphingorhabdus sp.]
MRLMQILLASAVALAAIPAHSQERSNAPAETAEQADKGLWVTLGTRGGPVASPTRSQPANLLVVAGKNYLVDAGDGSA